MSAPADAAKGARAPLDDAQQTAELFRQGMRRLAGACSVITSGDGGEAPGGWAGLTATAVSSLTAEPPRLLVCVNRRVWAHRAIAEHGALGVNVLDGDQEDLARRFAGQGECSPDAKFAQGDWRVGASGAPLLANALVSFDCKVAETIAASTHDIFVCDVLAVRFRDGPVDPLIYFNGAFMVGSATGKQNTEGRFQ